MAGIQTDICIIGAGSGGLSLAAGAVQMGAKVVLIEGAEMGGDCLNSGCVPSKALLAAARAVQGAPSPQDFTDAMAQVAQVIATIAPNDSQERFQGLGVQVIREWGRFIAPDAVQAGADVIRARRFVIATGSRAAIPPIPGIQTVPYLTNETVFHQTERPGHLLILGGGPIGLEMALAHRRLGCDVTVIEAARALGRDDPDAAAIVLDALRAQGVQIIEGQAVANLSPGVHATLTDGRVVTGSHLLVAAGRAVNIERLDLAAAGVAHTARGITVGPNLRSSNRRIYAMGDVAGGLQFTHVAGAHAGVLIRQILFGLPARAATLVPWVTYADPELAQIGPTEAQARAQYGAALTVLRQDFAHNDRAVATGKTTGFIKVMVVKSRPIGATIIGHGAGELIGLWVLAISARLKMAAIAGLILPYPTMAEISKRAAGSLFTPRLFDSPLVKRVVGMVQRVIP